MIKIFSTISIDHINNRVLGTVVDEIGGPATFISKALDKIKAEYELITGDNLEVDIQVDSKGETGKIRIAPTRRKIEETNCKILAVSTIYDEWILDNREYEGKVFLDIQGYVRDNGGNNRKKIDDEFLKNVFCMKGNKEEIECLPKKIVDQQKDKGVLIVTDGSSGIDLFYKSRYRHFDVMKITTKDTIGAGDTFLGYFIGYYSNGYDVDVCVEMAIKSTEEFLMSKKVE